MSGLFQLPSIESARAATDTTAGAWYPAGAQMETLSINTYTSDFLEFSALSALSIDFRDVAVTGGETAVCSNASFNCSFDSSHARLSNWPLAGSTPGSLAAIGGWYEPQANYFNWLNAYSASPTIAHTIRWGSEMPATNLNPFLASSVWDFYVVNNVYDKLWYDNPMCNTVPPIGSGVNACPNRYQLIDWMTNSHSFLCYPTGPACTVTNIGYAPPAGTTADLRISLNRMNRWQDTGTSVTAWDVKYSFLNLIGAGAFQTNTLATYATVTGIQVFDQFTLDFDLAGTGAYTNIGAELGIAGPTGVTIIPGHIWSTCGATTWGNDLKLNPSNIVGGVITNAQIDSDCIGTLSGPCTPGSSLLPPVGCVGTTAGAQSFAIADPITNRLLIGSGPYTCASTGPTGPDPSAPPAGTVGAGCSYDGTQSPPPSTGAYTLTRTGCNIVTVTCVAPGSAQDYFRSSGALATYIWTGDIGSGSADFSKVLTVNSCHSSTPSANCPHWAQGIGNPGGSGANPVGLSQRLRVNSLKGTSWIGFATDTSSGSLLTLTCGPGYTLPGTNLTPCTVVNAGWQTSVLPGIGAYAPTLYEVGSLYGGISTSTLAPDSAVGCASPVGILASAYPNAGYDC